MARAISCVAAVVAAAVGMGLAVEPRQPIMPSTGDVIASVPVTVVDRSHKGDRMPLATSVARQDKPQNKLSVTCDPAFRPLTDPAEAIVPGRCLASRAVESGQHPGLHA